MHVSLCHCQITIECTDFIKVSRLSQWLLPSNTGITDATNSQVCMWHTVVSTHLRKLQSTDVEWPQMAYCTFQIS